MLGRAECEGLDRHCGVIAAACDENAAVHYEQVGHIMGFVVLVHHRSLRIVSHPASAAVVRASARVAGHSGSIVWQTLTAGYGVGVNTNFSVNGEWPTPGIRFMDVMGLSELGAAKCFHDGDVQHRSVNT